MTKWVNALRRWFGQPEVPPAISGEHSVMFVLQSVSSPVTLADLSMQTRVSEDELQPVLDKLLQAEKISVTWGYQTKPGGGRGVYKMYCRK